MINRIRRLLEAAHGKLGPAISNVAGKIGLAILRVRANASAGGHARGIDISALQDFFFRVTRGRGLPKAAVAVAHPILKLAYYVLRDGSQYRFAGWAIGPVSAGKDCRTAEPPLAEDRLRGLAETDPAVARKAGADGAARNQTAPPPGQTCTLCHGWGIACIHVRAAKRRQPKGLSNSEHCG